jgi:hypothetical protein
MAELVEVEALAQDHGGVSHVVRQRLQEKNVAVDPSDRVDKTKAAAALKGWKAPHKKPE